MHKCLDTLVSALGTRKALKARELTVRILAVDDDSVILEILAAVFCIQDGYELECHSTAESGIAALTEAKHPFDCILLDIMLPGIGGIEMCQKLRQNKAYRSTPILMITASQQVDLMREAFNAGATDFIAKPFNSVELNARVRNAGMLNDSLIKARLAEHNLDELTQLVKIRFDEAISLDVIGASDALEIENRLLRMQPGCYAMTLIKLDIFGMRGIYGSVSAPIFRKCIETIAGTVADLLNDKDFELAYVGKGCFVGLILGRKRIDRNALNEAFNTSLERVWLEKIDEIPSPPKGKFDFIAGQRIWSGLSASDKLQDFIKGTETHKSFSASEETNLFSRLEVKMHSRSNGDL
jgi:sigma-B regulation protein RsbU (phosphoserine phosphatase)